jgi:hypothetical protein
VKLRILVAVLAAVALGVGVSAAQAVPRVLTVTNMSNDGPVSNGDNEVDIAVNPTNPTNMIARSGSSRTGRRSSRATPGARRSRPRSS